MTQTTQSSLAVQAKSNHGAAWLLGIGLVLFVAALCVNPVPESDLFWQLRTGEWIVSHHQPPHSDVYSWTRPGTPWVAHEWLSFVVLWTWYHVAGFGGLYLLTAVTVSMLFALHYVVGLKLTRAPLMAAVLSGGCAVVSSPFFQPRPQLATYLCGLITLSTLMWCRRTGASTKPLALLVPLFVIWANLHAGVLIGVTLVVVFAAGELVSYLIDRQLRSWRAFAWTAIACVAATFVTPYSFHVYENILSTVSNSTAMSIVAEWASPDFHQGYCKQIEVLIAVILYGMFFTRLARRPGDVVLLVILVHEALSANRNGPLLAILGMTLAAPHIHSALTWHLFKAADAPETSIVGLRPPGTIALLVVAAIVLPGFAKASSLMKSFGGARGSTLQKIGATMVVYGTYPDAACAFIRREQLPPSMRMFNIYDDGGFLIWRMPERGVFVDSRADVYFGPLLEDYRKIDNLNYRWRETLAKYGVDFIVVSDSQRQVQQYLPAEDWALVYADNGDLSARMEDQGKTNTLIFVRRDPQYAELISRCRRDCPAYAAVLQKDGQWASVR